MLKFCQSKLVRDANIPSHQPRRPSKEKDQMGRPRSHGELTDGLAVPSSTSRRLSKSWVSLSVRASLRYHICVPSECFCFSLAPRLYVVLGDYTSTSASTVAQVCSLLRVQDAQIRGVGCSCMLVCEALCYAASLILLGLKVMISGREERWACYSGGFGAGLGMMVCRSRRV